MQEVLLLNASEEVLNVIPWTRAFNMLLKGKARRPFGYEDDYEIQTSSGVFRLPTAIVLVSYVRVPHRKAAVNKKNLLRRDNYICQYCGKKLTDKSGTIEHIMPTSRGGKHVWENVAAACWKCNNKKDNKTPQEAGMTLRCVPSAPKRNYIVMQGIDGLSREPWTRWVEVN